MCAAIGGVEVVKAGIDYLKIVNITAKCAKLLSLGVVLSHHATSLNGSEINLEDEEKHFEEGKFRKVMKKSGRALSLHKLGKILKERVISVKRCAASLFGIVPSGLLTPLTMIFAGRACRHEYLIIHTDNHVIHAEITFKSTGAEPTLSIEFEKVVTSKPECSRISIENKFFNLHNYSRVLSTVRGDQLLEHLHFCHLNFYFNYLITVMRNFGQKDYSILTANCKTFSRSVLHFSKQSADLTEIVKSNIGNFNDRPLYIPPLDSILIEKSFYHLMMFFSENARTAMSRLSEMNHEMRSIPDPRLMPIERFNLVLTGIPEQDLVTEENNRDEEMRADA